MELMRYVYSPGMAFPTMPYAEEIGLECLRTAVETGCVAFNGGEFYGTPTNNSLTLLKTFHERFPELGDKIVLNVKGAMLPTFTSAGEPTVVRQSVENCVRQLERPIDMFELARKDTELPLESQLNTLKMSKEEGKIMVIALTEVSAETIREAVKLVDISAVEIEISLWCTDPLHNGILSTCHELSIPVFS